MTGPLPAPAPAVNPETREFWTATAASRLLLKRCLECGDVIWYPRAICPDCSSLRTEWFAASGLGTSRTATETGRTELGTVVSRVRRMILPSRGCATGR